MSPEPPRPAAAPHWAGNPEQQRCAIAADHPGLAGHFPGNPVVPGVLLLEEVVRAFEAWRPDERLVGMPVVKFLVPLRPGQAFAIRFVESGGRGIRFECVRDDGQPLARGCLTVAPPGDLAAGGLAPSPLRPK
jgi:hypothetical protein